VKWPQPGEPYMDVVASTSFPPFSVLVKGTVSGIQIRIQMFLGLQDPDPKVNKVTEERSQIRIRIRWSEVRIRGSGSAPKCHGSPTLRVGTLKHSGKDFIEPVLEKGFHLLPKENFKTN
jgi:hypothetical protein